MVPEIERIRNEADYEQALDEIEGFFACEPVPGTPEAARFDALARVIAAYEAENWPIEPEQAHGGRSDQTESRPATKTARR